MKYDEDWGEPRTTAAGALLQYAKKSPENQKYVTKTANHAKLKSKHKEVSKFLERLADLK